MRFDLSTLSRMSEKELCEIASSLGVDLASVAEELQPGKYLLKERGSLIQRIEQRWRDRQTKKATGIAWFALAVSTISAIVSLMALFKK